MAEVATIARPYAEAVFALADKAGALAQWSDTLGRLAAIARAPEMGQEEIGKFVDTATERAREMGHTIEGGLQETTKAVLHRFGMPTHQEIQALIARVEALNAKVEAMAKKEAE